MTTYDPSTRIFWREGEKVVQVNIWSSAEDRRGRVARNATIMEESVLVLFDGDAEPAPVYHGRLLFACDYDRGAVPHSWRAEGSGSVA